MFSIVIPLYNKGQYIEATLKSVLAQTLTQYEVLLIDDGSTDNSVAVVTPMLADSRVRLIRQANQGVSAARNNGIKHAAYEYVAFLDADDLWHPQYLEIMKHTLDQSPELGILGCAYERIAVGTSPGIKTMDISTIVCKKTDDYFKPGRKYLYFTSSSTVVKTSVFQKAGFFDEKLTCGEDQDQWNRIMLHCKGGYIDVLLAFYSYVPVIAGKYDYLPALHKHLVSVMIDKYRPYLEAKNGEQGDDFRRYTYFYVLSMLTAYYFTRNEKSAVRTVYKKVPLRYRYKRLRDFIILMPYPVGKFIFRLYN